MTSITDLSAHALSQLIATRDVSCLEVMQVFLERTVLNHGRFRKPGPYIAEFI